MIRTLQAQMRLWIDLRNSRWSHSRRNFGGGPPLAFVAADAVLALDARSSLAFLRGVGRSAMLLVCRFVGGFVKAGYAVRNCWPSPARLHRAGRSRPCLER